MNKKYIEDWEKLVRDWAKFKKSPSLNNLELIKQDLEEVRYGMDHINFS